MMMLTRVRDNLTNDSLYHRSNEERREEEEAGKDTPPLVYHHYHHHLSTLHLMWLDLVFTPDSCVFNQWSK